METDYKVNSQQGMNTMKDWELLSSFANAQQAFEDACKEGEEYDRRLSTELEEDEGDGAMRRNFEDVGDLMRDAIGRLDLK